MITWHIYKSRDILAKFWKWYDIDPEEAFRKLDKILKRESNKINNMVLDKVPPRIQA